MDKETLGEELWAMRVSLLRVSYGILRNSTDAEDAVSATIVRAYQQWEALRDDSRVKPWVMRIAVRCCYDLLRQRGRERPQGDMATYDRPVFDSFGDDSLYSLLQTLPSETAQVLMLYYYEGFSTAEIADILKLALPTVTMRLSRGRRRLKETTTVEGAESI